MKPFAVDNPCTETWHAMRRDGGGPARHCATCAERVYDLNAMIAVELRGLALLKGGSFCGRQLIRGGELTLRPPEIAPRRSLFTVVSRGMVVAGALAVAACDPVPAVHAAPPIPVLVADGEKPADVAPDPVVPDAPEPRDEPLMGKMVYVPPPIERDIRFAPGKATLTKETKGVLDTIVATLKYDATIASVSITGHVGPEELPGKGGTKLARRRAEAVRDYLVKQGIAAWRLSVFDGATSAATVEVRETVATAD